MTQPPQNEDVVRLMAKMLGLGLPARYIRSAAGPVVTTHLFTPAAHIPLSRYLTRTEDYALAVGTNAPVIAQRQGEHIAIAIPNSTPHNTDFKECLGWLTSTDNIGRWQLPLMLGMAPDGSKAAIDLTTCPHVLMCGQTNSGKSVLESAITLGLCMYRAPSELQMELVDTKRVDLTLLEAIPHVRSVSRSASAFNATAASLIREVYNRMTLLESAHVRNIGEYNVVAEQSCTLTKLPYIVLLIDELADLIDYDKAENDGLKKEERAHPPVSESLRRLAQTGRAAGLHIIACTQRSSVRIVNGDIKVNLPTRVALRLPTAADSRTVLGVAGAENLLGKGDMFVQTNDSTELQRFHGPYVSLRDIEAIIDNYAFVAQTLHAQREGSQ